MLKALRWPLLALIFSVILLSVALVVTLSDSDEDPSPEQPIGIVDTTATPESSPTVEVITTPVPTVAIVENRLSVVPAQLTEALVGNIRKINPLFANFNPVDRDIASLIFEGLTTINEFGEVESDLAERWEVSYDGLEYVFLLRRDILWQDGLPFTSEDVRFTIDTIRHPDFGGDASLTAFWRTVEMAVIDEYTIRFRLVQPLASFPEQLKIGIIPAHVFEGYPVAELDRHPFNLSPIGTGVYQRETLFAADGQFSMSLRVAPTYRQRPEGQQGYAIDRLVFRTYGTIEEAVAALARGEVNSIGSYPVERLSGLSSLNTIDIHTSVQPSIGVLIYNWQRDDVPYLQNQRVQIAFAQGLDRVTLVRQTLSGQALPAQSPLIPGSWAYDSSATYPDYNPDIAKASMDRIDVEEISTDSDDEPVEEPTEDTDTETEDDSESDSDESTESQTTTIRREFSILVIDSPAILALADEIARQWSALGFTVTVEALDQADYQQRLLTKDFDTAIVEFSYAPYADPDPYAFWHVSQAENGANYGGMQDLLVSEVLERARRETIGVNRVALYHDFQDLFTKRAPAITLYHPLYAYITSEHLSGVQLGFLSTPADRFRTIQNWKIE